jgi:LacI family transcriptional regulator
MSSVAEVSIKEIAEVAGVHRTTASKVLNNDAAFRINQATRKRILNAAQRLGFSRNDRFTPPRGVRSFGVLNTLKYNKRLNPFFSDVFDGIDTEAREQGLNIYLINSMERMNILQLLYQPEFMGILSLDVPQDLLAAFELAQKPLTGIEAPHHLTSSALYTVRTDSVQGMYEATRHLIAVGHRKIFYLSYRAPGGRESQVSLERFSGVALALKEAGLPVEENRVLADFICADGEEPAATARGYRAMLELLKRDISGPFACVCFSDLDAEGAARAAIEKGLRIPEDVSLVGYDNIPSSAEMSPPLTTVSVPRIELGRQAVRTILDAEAGHAAHETILPSQLVIRNSVLRFSI